MLIVTEIPTARAIEALNTVLSHLLLVHLFPHSCRELSAVVRGGHDGVPDADAQPRALLQRGALLGSARPASNPGASDAVYGRAADICDDVRRHPQARNRRGRELLSLRCHADAMLECAARGSVHIPACCRHACYATLTLCAELVTLCRHRADEVLVFDVRRRGPACVVSRRIPSLHRPHVYHATVPSLGQHQASKLWESKTEETEDWKTRRGRRASAHHSPRESLFVAGRQERNGSRVVRKTCSWQRQYTLHWFQTNDAPGTAGFLRAPELSTVRKAASPFHV
eukprot:2673713-Rhodomonas_salina.2